MNRSRFSKNTLVGIPAFFTLLALLLGITVTKAAPENPDAPGQPEIVSIQFNGGEVVVTVHVPKGIKKVTLEGGLASVVATGHRAPLSEWTAPADC